MVTDKENNKLISEFMGAKLRASYPTTDVMYFGEGSTVPCNNMRYHSTGQMKYDSSWEWLMPVIVECNKIGDLFEFESPEKGQFQESFYMENMWFELLNGDIKSIYRRVVSFIRWYNKLENNG